MPSPASARVGSAPARGVWVVLFDGDREVGRQRIPGIEAPLGFDPRTVRVGFPFRPVKKSHQLRVALDPDETLKEITRRNNSVAVECDTPTVPPKQHSSP